SRILHSYSTVIDAHLQFSVPPFFFETAPADFHTLSLPAALPTSAGEHGRRAGARRSRRYEAARGRRGRGRPVAHDRPYLRGAALDRKSTRLNSSHVKISYAVFCLKKKKERQSTKRKSRH